MSRFAERMHVSARALWFLLATFAITWVAWGALVALCLAHATAYGEPLYMSLYVVGGLGPTLAAYLAVRMTPALAPMREFNARVLRWRVPPHWYVIALGLPVVLGLVALGIAVALRPAVLPLIALKRWYWFVPLFGMTIVGGGLEEFGWRGILQEDWEDAMGPGRAALLIGPVWALWHLPLFALPGVAQYHAAFAPFLVGVIGNALLLGWLYSRTRSIALCVFMHAAGNAATMLGIAVPPGQGLSLVGPCLGLAVGALLFLSTPKVTEHA